MRSMSRPLVQSPLARPVAAGRPGQVHRALTVVPAPGRENQNTASLQRRTHADASIRSHSEQTHGHRQAHVHRPSASRELVRRRRTNVLFLLTMTFCGSLFLAATTKSTVMMYALALSFLSLCAFCYRLVQLREIERHAQHPDNTWFRAA